MNSADQIELINVEHDSVHNTHVQCYSLVRGFYSAGRDVKTLVEVELQHCNSPSLVPQPHSPLHHVLQAMKRWVGPRNKATPPHTI